MQPPPDGLALMGVFLELDRSRASAGFGPSAISYADIAAWMHLHEVRLTGWEVDTLCEMDATALRTMAEGRKSGGKG